MKVKLIEQGALSGDTDSVRSLVNTLRLYRASVEWVISQRYSDGAIDGACMSSFRWLVDAIEHGHGDIEVLLKDIESGESPNFTNYFKE
jgi:hypothetical protein